jgi:hypothetical protein
MRRRNFLAGAATLGGVLPSLAQTGGAIRRIGVLGNNPPSLPVVVPLWARVAVAGAMWRIDQEREGLGPGLAVRHGVATPVGMDDPEH